MNMINIIWTAIKAAWTLFVNSFRNTAGTLWKMVKLAIANIQMYKNASPEEREIQTAAYVATFKVWAISLTLTGSASFVIWSLFGVTIGKLLGFLPAFVLDAIGYLVVMLLTGSAIRIVERLGLRTDVVCNAQQLKNFAIDALIPWMILVCFRNPSDQNVLMLLSCFAAFAAYNKILTWKAAPATPAPASAQTN